VNQLEKPVSSKAEIRQMDGSKTETDLIKSHHFVAAQKKTQSEMLWAEFRK
jgi:hypothetical protein